MTTFISYSRANSDFAVRLAKDLKAAGQDVWLDQLDIPTGARWDDELEKALRKCNTFLIILSPESIASQNVKDEIGYAIDSGKRILPVMIKQCDVPFRMRRFQYVDFTQDDYDERFEEIKGLLSNTSQLQTAKEAEKSPAQANISKSKPSSSVKKSLPMPALLGGGGVVLAIIIGFIVISNRDSPAPDNPDEPQASVIATNTPIPGQIDAPEDSAATAAPTSTPEPQPFFTEEFDEDTSEWSTFVTSGDINKLDIRTENGMKIFELSDSESDLFAYSILDDFTYTDVTLEVVASNRGVNDNNVSLICRYSEGSWYEFNIANNGLYDIIAYDSVNGYDPLFSGASNAIFPGTSTNKYTATCEGNKLSLWINDEEVRSITVSRYNYNKGKIGLSVSSFGVLPVKVDFESLIVSEP